MALNLIGERFGRLTVVQMMAESDPHQGRRWLCRCDCGKEIVATTPELTCKGRMSRGCMIGRSQKSGGGYHYQDFADKRTLAKDRKARAANMEAIRAMVRNAPGYGKIAQEKGKNK